METTEQSSYLVAPPGRPYVVRLRRRRAYLLAGLVPAYIAFLTVAMSFLVRILVEAHIPPGASVTLTWVQGLLVVATLTWMATRAFTTLRNPPRIDTQGLWLWLPGPPEQVFVPWEHVVKVCIMRRALGRRGLYVYVHVPESAQRDEAQATRIRQVLRRTGGAFVSAPIDRSPRRLRELDVALRSLSGGWNGLRYCMTPSAGHVSGLS